MKSKEWSDEELDARAAQAKQLGQRPQRWTPANGGWTGQELALLGTDHDEVIAKKLKRTRDSVRSQRALRKIPAFSARVGSAPAWTAEQLALLGTDTDEAIAARIGRTPGAVTQKRGARKVPKFRYGQSR